jgi:long-chain acyl-CoA synthetase
MSTDIWSFIAKSLRSRGDQEAWICRLIGGKRRVYTYRDICEYALDAAFKLRQHGVRAGEIVGILAPNGPEWGVGALAVWKLGAIVAPIHTGNSDDEVVAQLAALDPKVVLVHGVERRVQRAEPIPMERESDHIEREAGIETLIAPSSEAVRLCTSGSTGTPKMVRLSHANVHSNVVAASRCAHIDSSDRFLSLLPLSHMMEITGGFLLPLYSGATIVLPRVLAAQEILDAMATEKVTALIAVPRLFRNIMLGLEKRFSQGGPAMRAYRAFLRIMPVPVRRVVNFPIRRRLGGRIKAWISGGSRLDPEIARYFRELGIPLRQGYGLTETSPVISLQENFEPVIDSVGRPLEGVEVRVHDPDRSGSGELWVRGPNVMLGYVDEGQTREVMVEENWFRTGDLARLDSSGNIVLTGRSKRLIVTEAGKNVYPEELETLLERIPGIKEAGVFEQDMKPVAVLAVEGLHQVEHARQILKEFNARVSKHNQITRFALVDELPRTPVGKVALKRLPEMFAAKEITR